MLVDSGRDHKKKEEKDGKGRRKRSRKGEEDKGIYK